ncbi:MAG: BPSL0067 family protein [Candidatus Gracilibacteria bacterium]|nr:BPSL0067 family protein [Candidatus Gracilibacteria bacterium]
MKAKMKSTFNTALNKIFKDKNNLETVIIQNNLARKLLYKNSNEYIKQFGVTEKNDIGHISLTNKVDYDYGYKNQCVGFVKAVTDLGTTSTWIKGEQVTDTKLPARGDVIATFGANGKYNNKHVAIVLSTSKTHIYVIDQNWEGTGNNSVGRIIVHALKFTGNGVNNVNNYYIVKK